MRRRDALIALGGIAALGGLRTAFDRAPATDLASGTWPEFGATPANVGTQRSASGPADGRIEWSTRIDRLDAGPVVDGDSVYVAPSGRGVTVIALDAATGDRRWRSPGPTSAGRPFRGAAAGTPVVREGLLVGVTNRRVRAFDPDDGTVGWTARLDRPALFNGMTTAMDTVLAATGEALVALDAATGEQRWKWTPSAGYLRPPCVRDGLLYVPTSAGRLHALSMDGRHRGAVPVGHVVTPAVATGRSVFGVRRPVSSDGGRSATLVAVDRRTGRVRWTVPLSATDAVAGVAVADETVVVAAEGRAIDLERGRDDLPMDRPAVTGVIEAVDGANGDRRWSTVLPDGVTTPPAIADGTVYVGSGTGVRGVALADGANEFAASTTVAPDRPLAIAGDRLYVLNSDWRVAAIR